MKVKLSSFLREITIKTTENNQYPVLTSSKRGIFLQSDYFNKQVASKNNTGYKVIRRGQFTYRAMSDTGEFFPNMLECADLGIVSPAYPVFEIVDTKTVMPAYLKYYFKSNSFQHSITSFVQGSTRTSVKFEKLKTTVINLISRSKQEEAVETLDRVTVLIALRKRQLSELDNLIKARFVELFGDPDTNPLSWSEANLCDHLEVVGGYAFKSEGFEEEGIPVLRIGNINSGYFLPANMVFWRDDSALARYKVYPGDLVMSLTGTVGKEDYGNVCILGSDYDVYYLNQRNAKLALRSSLNKYYLSEMLKFARIKNRLTGISRGVRQANISNKDILCLRVPIPPIELQEQFSAFVAQIDKSRDAVQQALDKTQQLFDSLMQQYFA